jgi:YggT family protein
MFVVSNLLMGVTRLLDLVLNLYMWVIILRAAVSWVNPDPYHPFVRFLYSVTEPVLSPVRRRVPLLAGGLDLSPLLVILAIVFLRSFVVRSLLETAYRLS